MGPTGATGPMGIHGTHGAHWFGHMGPSRGQWGPLGPWAYPAEAVGRPADGGGGGQPALQLNLVIYVSGTIF